MLVAEDNGVNRKVIAAQLTRLGVSAEVVPDAHAALERWRAQPYALLLTDLQMPGMDGRELTRNLRAEEAPLVARGLRKRMPIVALTANAVKDELELCLSSGMDDYLTKPVTMRVMLDALTRWAGDPTPSDGDLTPRADSR